jgi:hypothetical protein
MITLILAFVCGIIVGVAVDRGTGSGREWGA